MNLAVALTIAGSDCSAGAGIQADLKTMSALGTYGLTAVTGVVAEVPRRVSALRPLDPPFVAEQMRLVLAAFPVQAIKTGLLFNAHILGTVADTLLECAVGIPLIVDPVMVATSGDALLDPAAVEIYRERLFPMATLVTPNLDEARALLGRPVANVPDMHQAAKELAELFGTAFLVKGGHLSGSEAVDVLCWQGVAKEFRMPFIAGVATHGTGCTYSAAIAAELAKGATLLAAVENARRFVGRALAGYLRWPQAQGQLDALHHFAPQKGETNCAD